MKAVTAELWSMFQVTFFWAKYIIYQQKTTLEWRDLKKTHAIILDAERRRVNTNQDSPS